MAKRKLTPWIPAKVKPVIEGWYDRNYADGTTASNPARCYWNGKWWSCATTTTANAMSEKSADQSLKWRGLAEDPNK